AGVQPNRLGVVALQGGLLELARADPNEVSPEADGAGNVSRLVDSDPKDQAVVSNAEELEPIEEQSDHGRIGVDEGHRRGASTRDVLVLGAFGPVGGHAGDEELALTEL